MIALVAALLLTHVTPMRSYTTCEECGERMFCQMIVEVRRDSTDQRTRWLCGACLDKDQ